MSYFPIPLTPCHVSIPQGPINTYRNTGKRDHKLVSIPQGPINTESNFPTYTVSDVSIPQGPINTRHLWLRNPCKWVSIPQGPINTVQGMYRARGNTRFQFRKVQLIQGTKAYEALQKSVSIPQGPINTGMAVKLLSQFLVSIPQGPINTMPPERESRLVWSFNSARSN